MNDGTIAWDLLQHHSCVNGKVDKEFVLGEYLSKWSPFHSPFDLLFVHLYILYRYTLFDPFALSTFNFIVRPVCC
jgi:hypothetical protein